MPSCNWYVFVHFQSFGNIQKHPRHTRHNSWWSHLHGSAKIWCWGMCVCVCAHAYALVCICVCVCMCVCVCVLLLGCVCACVCVHVCTCACVCVCYSVCACAYACGHICCPYSTDLWIRATCRDHWTHSALRRHSSSTYNCSVAINQRLRCLAAATFTSSSSPVRRLWYAPNMSRCSACRTHQYPQDNPTDGFMCRIIRMICKTNFRGLYTASKAASGTQTIQKWWWWWTPSLRYQRGNQLLAVHRTPRYKATFMRVRPFFKTIYSQTFPFMFSPPGLTFVWWVCCRLCLWHKPSELAHSFLFCSRVCFCLHDPFSSISLNKFTQ